MNNPKSQIPNPKPPNNILQIGHWSLVIGISAVSFLLRILPIGRYVTPDEPIWVYRAIRFADALSAHDWGAIPATGHPGVTTMWLGAAGVAVQRLLDPAGSVTHLDWIRHLAWLAPENGEAFRHLAFFLPAGRVTVAVVTTLGLVALYPLLARVFDRRTALLTVGLLAIDPFLIGHSGLLHTDALLATFILLALATALRGLQQPRHVVWPALSGTFTGLALLTKTPAIVLLPFILLLQATSILPPQSPLSMLNSRPHTPQPDSTNHTPIRFLGRRSPITRHPPSATGHWTLVIRHWSLDIGHWSLNIGHWLLVIGHCSLFLLSAAITCLALYPRLWADPAGTLGTLSAFAGKHVEMVQRPIFFAGQMTYDPGAAFYPAVLLFRISPVALVGLVAGLVVLGRLPAERRFIFLLSIAFAVTFGALMTLGAKKHDRYLLPAFPVLTLAAALGIGEAVDRYIGKLGNRAAHMDANLPTYQSTNLPISQSTNPPISQPTNFPVYPLLIIGFQTLITLLFLPYPLTAFNPLAGGPWVAARVLPVDWGEGMGAAARWLNHLPNAEQLTVAASSVPSFAPLFEGRTLPLDQDTLADYLVLAQTHSATSTSTPTHATVHTISLTSLDRAEILSNTAAVEQAAYLATRAGADDLILLDADTPLLRSYAGPGTLLSTTDLPGPSSMTNRLGEWSAGRSTAWLVADPGASPITAFRLRQGLEAIATPVHTATVASATITQFSNLRPQSPKPRAEVATFGEDLTLVLMDALLPTHTVNAPFRVFLRWQVPAPTSAEMHASLALRDAAGHTWAEVGQPVVNDVHFPTTAWVSGEWSDSNMKPKLPEHIPPGTYAVLLTVTDATGAQLGAWNSDGQFQGVRAPLGHVAIAPPTEPVGPPSCTEDHTLTAAPFLACVSEPPPDAIPSGDTLTLALTWTSIAAPEADYRIRWRMLEPTGAIALEEITALCAYATDHWRAGDSFECRYDLRLDPGLAGGRYRLALNVLAPGGSALWAEDETLVEVEIVARDRLFELPDDVTHPLDLTLGDAVHLRGFDLIATAGRPAVSAEEGTGDVMLQPGDTLPLTLYWQADGPTDLDYTVFVHIVGPDGLPHGQVDAFPAGGAAPTSSWAPGQVVVDEIALPLATGAPAGRYHIAVGMYSAASGGRLPVTDAFGSALPDDQAVLPLEITVAGAQP